MAPPTRAWSITIYAAANRAETQARDGGLELRGSRRPRDQGRPTGQPASAVPSPTRGDVRLICLDTLARTSSTRSFMRSWVIFTASAVDCLPVDAARLGPLHHDFKHLLCEF